MSDLKIACSAAEQIKNICVKFRNNPGELIHILHEVHHQYGYLPEEVQRLIARQLNIPVSRVYERLLFLPSSP